MPLRHPLAAGLLATALIAAGCGNDKENKGSATSNTLAVTVSETGKKARFTAPASAKGGLTRVTLENSGKMPHTAQLIRLEGGHTTQEALKVIGSNSDKIPDWIHGEGGPVAGPGATGTATVNLPAGKYVIADMGEGGPPATTNLTVSGGKKGTIPSAPVSVTAAEPREDHFKWDLSGTLKPGSNEIKFDSKGKESLHFIGAVRLKRDVPLNEIKKALARQGRPPAFLDEKTFYTTTVLDGGKSEATSLELRGGPGTYVLFCPLKDRDGGKAHDQEGLLTKLTVK